MQFFETSAKSGKNIELVFHKSASSILESIKDGKIDPANEDNGVKAFRSNLDNVQLED